MINSEIQCIDICTTGPRLTMVVGVDARSIVFISVPDVAVAGGDMVCVIIMGADSQVQCVGTGATVDICVSKHVRSCSGIGHVVPCIAFTSGNRIAIVRAMVDGKIKRYRAVTACHIVCIVCWSIGCGIICDSIPTETITGDNRFYG